MSDVGVKLRRFKYNFRHEFLTVENVFLFIAIAICLVCTYRSIEAMNRNWELSEKLNSAQKNLELKKIEVETAELENAYYSSDEYQELAARKFANKQLDGENMVYMPANTEEAKNKHADENAKKVEETKEYSNFEQWMMYLWP
ncbi:MAG: hypothetical protein Q4B87_02390 [Candidatus Saccharibacteria bacterium]|nr:hypothetical protein [Candidatus Saccharibacteria bacterium]